MIASFATFAFSQEFYILDLQPEKSISVSSAQGNGEKFKSNFEPFQLKGPTVVEDIAIASLKNDLGAAAGTHLVRWYKQESFEGKSVRRQTDRYFLISDKDFRAHFRKVTGPNGTVKISDERSDQLIDNKGAPLYCAPRNSQPEIQRYTNEVLNKATADGPVARNDTQESLPKPSPAPRAKFSEPTSIEGEDIQVPTGPIADEQEFQRRKALLQKRTVYYQALLSKFSEYRLATKLLDSVRKRDGLSELEQRPLRLEAVRGFLRHAKNDPFFAGERGARRLDDLVAALTISMEFISEIHGSPYNFEASYSVIRNRANPDCGFQDVYCDISLNYAPDPQSILRGEDPEWMSRSMTGVSLAANIKRTTAETEARLSSRSTLIKRLIEKQGSTISEDDLIQRVRDMSDTEITNLLSSLLSEADARAFRSNPNQPELVQKVNEALWQELIVPPSTMRAQKKDLRFGYQFSAWDFTNPNLGFVLMLGNPNGKDLRPLEWQGVKRAIDHLAAHDAGLVTVKGSGFSAATHYLSPEGFEDGGKATIAEWSRTMTEINYPVVIREDLQPNRQPRTSFSQDYYVSVHSPNQIRVFRPKGK